MKPASFAFVASLCLYANSATAATNTPPASDPTSPTPFQVDAPKNAPPPRRIDVRITLDSGIFKDEHSGGFVFGGELLHRRGLLALGVVGEYGTTLVTPYRYWGGSGGAGISLPTPSWVRVDLLGLVGLHRYEGVGGAGVMPWSVFVNDPGIATTLPSVGARLSAAVELGGRARFVIGVKGLIDRDLGERTRSHTRTSSFSPPETQMSTIGGMRLGALLTLGGTIGE